MSSLPELMCTSQFQVQLTKDSMVVPLLAGAGTWRQSAVFDAKDLHVVPDDITIEHAATMSVK